MTAPMVTTRPQAAWIALTIGTATVAVDQATKAVAVDRVPVAHNAGGAFGAFAASPALFGALTALFLGLLAMKVARRGDPLGWAGWALATGGAASNLADRIARGAVVDFVPAGAVTFNLADVAIVAGGAVLLAVFTRAQSSRGRLVAGNRRGNQ